MGAKLSPLVVTTVAGLMIECDEVQIAHPIPSDGVSLVLQISGQKPTIIPAGQVRLIQSNLLGPIQPAQVQWPVVFQPPAIADEDDAEANGEKIADRLFNKVKGPHNVGA